MPSDGNHPELARRHSHRHQSPPARNKTAITGEVGDALKLSITAPPVDGKANAACIDFLAKLLNLPRSSVTIAAGETSRNKVIRVVGKSAEEIKVYKTPHVILSAAERSAKRIVPRSRRTPTSPDCRSRHRSQHRLQSVGKCLRSYT